MGLFYIGDDNMTNKTLITYFSASGRTKAQAEKLQELLSADIYEIEAERSYTKEDLDWKNKESRSSVEMKDEAARPEIKGELPDISTYDRILIGFPIWWGVSPKIILSFLDKIDCKDKKIYPFATSGASPVEPAVDFLKKAYGDKAFGPGLLINIDPTVPALEDWLK